MKVKKLIPLVACLLTGCMATMQNDIAEIKQNQEAIKQELANLKNLLQTRQIKQTPKAQAINSILDVSGAPTQGAQNAKLTLVEFTDYQCPFCKQHVQTTLPQLEKAYVSTGKLRYLLRDFPLEALHKHAQQAAEAALCAGDQNKYWQMHDKLFANQQALDLENLSNYAKAIGLKKSSFKECLTTGKYAETVRRNSEDGHKLGITGTPSFLLGVSDGNKVKNVRLIVGAQPFPVFKQEIDEISKEIVK
jgi:protein-disulfide isomerase